MYDTHNLRFARELVIDGYRCDGELSCPETTLTAVRNAALSVGATVLEEHVTGYEGKGLTAVAHLAESHIVLSTWPEHNYATVNIFLCNQDMRPEQVRNTLFEHLRPKTWREGWFLHSIGGVCTDASGPRVFLAAPFTEHFGPDSPDNPCIRDQIENVTSFLRANGASVFSAHEREKWGKAVLEPRVCTELDFAEMRDADVVVALLDEHSYGVCVELGWASALHVPIISFSSDADTRSPSPLVEGIHAVTRTSSASNLEQLGRVLEDLRIGFPCRST
jgi:S-adenosylmethionine decarboxylase